MSVSSLHPFLVATGAFEEVPCRTFSSHLVENKNRFCFPARKKNFPLLILQERRAGSFFEAKNWSWAGPLARHPDPPKPRFWACQKVVPPPCKNVQKMGFLGEKACIFGQFVHNFAQKWPLFCGHSPPLQGCQSVGKKPANLYSTKCRIFGPRTPPPVAPWWDTSSRRPPTGSRRPFLQNPKNRTFPKYDDVDRMSPITFFINYIMK